MPTLFNNQTGLAAYVGAAASSIQFRGNQFSLGSHFSWSNGANVDVRDNWGLSQYADPWDGTPCLMLQGAGGSYVTGTPNAAYLPATPVCDMTAVASG